MMPMMFVFCALTIAATIAAAVLGIRWLLSQRKTTQSHAG